MSQSPKEGIAAVSQTHPPPRRRSSFKRGVQVADLDSDGNRLSIEDKLASYSLLRKTAKEELLSAVTVAGCMVIALGGVVEVPSVYLPISHTGMVVMRTVGYAFVVLGIALVSLASDMPIEVMLYRNEAAFVICNVMMAVVAFTNLLSEQFISYWRLPAVVPPLLALLFYVQTRRRDRHIATSLTPDDEAKPIISIVLMVAIYFPLLLGIGGGGAMIFYAKNCKKHWPLPWDDPNTNRWIAGCWSGTFANDTAASAGLVAGVVPPSTIMWGFVDGAMAMVNADVYAEHTVSMQPTWHIGYALGSINVLVAVGTMWSAVRRSRMSVAANQACKTTATQALWTGWSITLIVSGFTRLLRSQYPPPGTGTLACTEELGLSIIFLLFPLCVMLFQKTFFGFVSRLFERTQALQDGVLIASLLESGSPKVGDEWHIHDDNAFKATLPRAKKWYKGVVREAFDDHFVVEVVDKVALPLDGSVRKMNSIRSVNIVDPQKLVELASATLYCIDFKDVSFELFADDNPTPTEESHKLARRCKPGEIDWFISHSWRDNAVSKWAAFLSEAEAFKELHGSYPVIWLDKVCIDQKNIMQSLKCLPIYLLSCKGMLVLGGPTYISRLWCLWELYTLFAMANGADDGGSGSGHVVNVKIKEFSNGGTPGDAQQHDGQVADAADSSTQQLPPISKRRGSIHSAGTKRRLDLPFKEQLKMFSLERHTRCYDPNEEAKIMRAIRAAPGGEHAFEKTIRLLASHLPDIINEFEPSSIV